VGEHGAERGQLGREEAERGGVREVGDVPSAVAEGPPRRPHVGQRRQVRRHPRASVHVRDHRVERTGRLRLQCRARIGGLGADAGAGRQRQLLGDEREQLAVHVDDVLPGAGPGGGGVPRQGQRAGAAVQHRQRTPGRRRGVEDVAHAPRVLELQVPRIAGIDVRLGRAVESEQPCARAVDVRQQLGQAAVDAPAHGYRFAGHVSIVRPVRRPADARSAGAERELGAVRVRVRGW